MCTLFKSESRNYVNSTMAWTHLLYSYWLDVISYIINIMFASEQQWGKSNIKFCAISPAVLRVLLFTLLETSSWMLQFFLTGSIITRVSCLSMHQFKCFKHETNVSNTKKAFSCFFVSEHFWERWGCEDNNTDAVLEITAMHSMNKSNWLLLLLFMLLLLHLLSVSIIFMCSLIRPHLLIKCLLVAGVLMRFTFN